MMKVDRYELTPDELVIAARDYVIRKCNISIPTGQITTRLLTTRSGGTITSVVVELMTGVP